MTNNVYGFLKDGKRFRKIYIACEVYESESLIQLQKTIAEEIPDFEPIPSKRWHLTISHFGEPDLLYERWFARKITLNFDEFLQYFTAFLAALRQIIPRPITTRPASISGYGRDGTVVGVSLNEPYFGAYTSSDLS